MAKRPLHPLLRLDAPKPRPRVTRPGFPRPRKIDNAEQVISPAGQRLQALSRVLASGADTLQLQRDPTGLAPERLLVFDLTADVSGFMKAAARVPGLEFIGADELEADAEDKNPALYLMIPDARALNQMVGLWSNHVSGKPLPLGFAPWRDLFHQMRDLRPWGPQDRLTAEDRLALSEQRADVQGNVRIEVELVFRSPTAALQDNVAEIVRMRGGRVVSSTRIEGARYHSLLVDVPIAEVRAILAQGYEGLIGSEAVMHIRPQSAVHLTTFEVDPSTVGTHAQPPLPTRSPIAAIFDAVPMAGHPRLAGRLSLEDPFGLEHLAVGPRLHGTAMASAVIHGDLLAPPLPALDRQIHFINMMYAPAVADDSEKFPDRLPADLFHEAIVRMKSGLGPSAPGVIVVNASLGDRNKPFAGKMSGWARVIDYLSHAYGVLFIISAGNHDADLLDDTLDTIEFENLSADEKARLALRASGAAMAYRRVLAPAESINALTVGALHQDNFVTNALPAWTFDLWANTGLCSISSGLGPGHAGAVKPDILAPGGRHHVRLFPNRSGLGLRPLGKQAGTFGGIQVAAPPSGTNPSLDQLARTIGTSVAAAQVTGLACRAHEALEEVYPDFLDIPDAHRAVLLKALLVHSARWTQARDLIIDILGPSDPKQHVRRKDNVRRFLGYGAIDGQVILECAEDRATLWSVGQLSSDQAHTLRIPLPASMAGKAVPHEVSLTVAWMAPPRVGVPRYRGVQIKMIEPSEGNSMLAVSAEGDQPDINQIHNGTVAHRRWEGAKAAAFGENATFDIVVQRQVDDIEAPIPYAAVVTLKMDGVRDLYVQVRDRLAIRPPVAVPIRS